MLFRSPRGFLGRRSGMPAVTSMADASLTNIGAGLADEALARIDEQALWARIGLSAPR